MMKKNFILPLLAAAAALTGVAQGADPVATWTGTSDSLTVSTNSTDTFSNGDWSIKIGLDPTALYNTFVKEPEDSGVHGVYEGSDTLGQGLFTINGDAYQKRGTVSFRDYYEDQSTTVVMGWGNDWYATMGSDGNRDESADNGVVQGLQIGLADKTSNVNTNTETGKSGYDMGVADSNDRAFDVYRFDTKVQNTESGWSIDESANSGPASTVTTLDAIVQAGGITAADLYIVHDTDGGWFSEGRPQYYTSTTDMYFIVTLENGETLRYMARVDDTSTFSEWWGNSVGTLGGGSAFYDVDFIENITEINTDLVDSMEVYDTVITVPTMPINPNVPEPASATLSMMALSALCARRRRRK